MNCRRCGKGGAVVGKVAFNKGPKKQLYFDKPWAEIPKFTKVEMPLCMECGLANIEHTRLKGPWWEDEFKAWTSNAGRQV